jgi:hypothetical protein
MTTKAEETLYLVSRLVALPCSGGGKAIPVKVGPEKLDKITAPHAMCEWSLLRSMVQNSATI